MSTKTLGSQSWLWAAGVALAIIAGFSLWVHSRPAKSPGPESSPNSRQQAITSAETKPTGLDLVGVVRGTEGQALTNASIFIYTAQPRSGPGFT